MRKMKATAQKGAATRVSDDGNERNVQGFLANPNISLRRKISRNGSNNISSDVWIPLLTYFHKGGANITALISTSIIKVIVITVIAFWALGNSEGLLWVSNRIS